MYQPVTQIMIVYHFLSHMTHLERFTVCLLVIWKHSIVTAIWGCLFPTAAIVLLCTHDVLQFKKFVVYEVVGDAIKRMWNEVSLLSWAAPSWLIPYPLTNTHTHTLAFQTPLHQQVKCCSNKFGDLTNILGRHNLSTLSGHVLHHHLAVAKFIGGKRNHMEVWFRLFKKYNLYVMDFQQNYNCYKHLV